MQSSVVALMSDFGLSDWYVGVIKGVILSMNADAEIVDVVHTIPRHDVVAASFALLACYRFFPAGTVFVAIVDPGVGGPRKVICADSASRFFLAPDNGLLTGVLSKEGYEKIVSVENEDLFLKPVSSTFHGRDIFAPAAAHLSMGLAIDRLGGEVETFEAIESPGPMIEDDSAVATIRWIDWFGNLITNCSEELVTRLEAEWRRVTIDFGEATGIKIVPSYESVERGRPLGIVGSSGYLEISVREGSARDVLDAGIGQNLLLRRG